MRTHAAQEVAVTTDKSGRTSAGILLWRRRDDRLEVLLAHMGGPHWVHKDRHGIDLEAQLDQPFGTSAVRVAITHKLPPGRTCRLSLRRVHHRCRRASETSGPRSRAARSVSWVHARWINWRPGATVWLLRGYA
jgi:hypothetical protein